MSQQKAIQRLREAVHEQNHDKPPKIRTGDVTELLAQFDRLGAMLAAGKIDNSAANWRDPEGDPPANYVPVLVKLQDGYVRVGRRGPNYWAFAEFLHDSYTRNKYPPISQRNNPVVGWLPILPEDYRV